MLTGCWCFLCDRVWAECCQPHRCPLYLIAGRDWRQRQMTEPSLDTALQPGAGAVISSPGRGGDAGSGCDHLQDLCRRRAASLSLRRKRRCFGAEWMCKPAQGSHGCLHWGVVTTNTHTYTGQSSSSPATPSSREMPWVFQVAQGFQGVIWWEWRKCSNHCTTGETKHLKYVSSVFKVSNVSCLHIWFEFKVCKCSVLSPPSTLFLSPLSLSLSLSVCLLFYALGEGKIYLPGHVSTVTAPPITSPVVLHLPHHPCHFDRKAFQELLYLHCSVYPAHTPSILPGSTEPSPSAVDRYAPWGQSEQRQRGKSVRAAAEVLLSVSCEEGRGGRN